ncbi:MAG: XTP/dITP diphosphatase [Desulfomonilaceae bacterium]
MSIRTDKIVIATRNWGKLVEIKKLLQDTNTKLLSLDDFPDIPEVLEDGATFEENALKKALFVGSSTGMTALADDSGLCVDALSGRPGILSARYGGPNLDDKKRYGQLLEEMKGISAPFRTARFVCVVALASPDGEHKLFKGVCDGRILNTPRGEGGFGYDPVFFYEEIGLSFGEMDPNTKNRVSHRARALKMLTDFIKNQ